MLYRGNDKFLLESVPVTTPPNGGKPENVKNSYFLPKFFSGEVPAVKILAR